MHESPIPVAKKVIFQILAESNHEIISVELSVIPNSSRWFSMRYLFSMHSISCPHFNISVILFKTCAYKKKYIRSNFKTLIFVVVRKWQRQKLRKLLVSGYLTTDFVESYRHNRQCIGGLWVKLK